MVLISIAVGKGVGPIINSPATRTKSCRGTTVGGFSTWHTSTLNSVENVGRRVVEDRQASWFRQMIVLESAPRVEQYDLGIDRQPA
jgi:hypothetical protein